MRHGACPAGVITARCRREDWATSWKKHFKTMEIGSALLIKPSWSKRKARPGQAVVTLDPGLSFGTGQHPTTAFCLEQVVSDPEKGTTAVLSGHRHRFRDPRHCGCQRWDTLRSRALDNDRHRRSGGQGKRAQEPGGNKLSS